jgi:hypothetical protein
MDVRFLDTEGRPRSGQPLELLFTVDGKTLRVAIDWTTLGEVFGLDLAGEDSWGTFLRKKRQAIELAVKAHLLARGMPFGRQLVLTAEDFSHTQQQA